MSLSSRDTCAISQNRDAYRTVLLLNVVGARAFGIRCEARAQQAHKDSQNLVRSVSLPAASLQFLSE